MLSTAPRFEKDPVSIGRTVGPETYDVRAKPGIEVYAPDRKSPPFANSVARFALGAAAALDHLGPGAYDAHPSAVAVRDPLRASAPFASRLHRFSKVGFARGAEATPAPALDMAKEAARSWTEQPSVASAWPRARRFDGDDAEQVAAAQDPLAPPPLDLSFQSHASVESLVSGPSPVEDAFGRLPAAREAGVYVADQVRLNNNALPDVVGLAAALQVCARAAVGHRRRMPQLTRRSATDSVLCPAVLARALSTAHPSTGPFLSPPPTSASWWSRSTSACWTSPPTVS